MSAIDRETRRTLPGALVLLAKALGASAIICGAHGAAAAPKSDPAVIARAKACGARQYSNADDPLPSDHFADGAGPDARFLHPLGVAVDAHGVVYVADTDNRVIRRISPDGRVTTLAGTPGRQGCSDGVGAQARFYEVRSIAVDRDGTVLIADAGTNAIRRITSAGEVSTLEIREETPSDARGAVGVRGAAFLLNNNTPMGLAVDGTSKLYVTLMHAVLEISPSGATSSLAGSSQAHARGTTAWSDDTAYRDGVGAAARFSSLYGIAVASTGTVYVSDNSLDVIKAIASNGATRTFAGAIYDHAFPQISSVEGEASRARFFVPEGIAVDRTGTLYVADRRNSTIRKITPAGEVSTLAGAARETGSVDGTGSAARFVSPTAVAVDADGNLYVADSTDNTIRKVTAEGVVTTLAGRSALRNSVGSAADLEAAPPPASVPPDPDRATSGASARTTSGASDRAIAAPRELAANLSRLASQEYVISPREVADALKLPPDKFKWFLDGSGGWVDPEGAFEGTAIRSAMLSYRRRMASDGTVSGGQIAAPWRAAFVSLVINLADQKCLPADDVAAEAHVPGSAVRTARDLAAGSAPTLKTGVEFAIAKGDGIRKLIILDGRGAHGVWLYKWNFTGEDLPIGPTP